MNQTIYSDLDITFRRHAITGDILKKTNTEDIKQSLALLLNTRFYDRCWHPEIGSYLPKMMFNQDDSYIKDIMRDQITNLITNYEPRITLENIWIGHASQEDVSNGKVTIRIDYYINVLNHRDTYIYTITRLR